MQPLEKIRSFCNLVCEQIRWKKSHKLVYKELENHIIDQRDVFISTGMSEDTATDKAIEETGNPVLLGTELDRVHKPKPQFLLLAIIGILVLIGIFSQILLAQNNDVSLLPQVISYVLGIGILFAIYFADFTLIAKYASIFYLAIISLSFLMIYLPIRSSGKYYLILLFPIAFAALVYEMQNKKHFGLFICCLAYIIPASILTYTHFIAGLILFILSAFILLTVAIIKGWYKIKKIYGF